MVIGNIICDNKNDDSLFNYCEDIDAIDNKLPSLIVGWDRCKDQIKDASILNHKINDKLYWSFSKEEDRRGYDDFMGTFKEICFSNLIGDINYVFVDIILFNFNKIKKIIKKIYSLDNPITYLHNGRMVYVYGDNLIFGIDLDLLRYFNINENNLTNKLKAISCDFLVDEDIFNRYKGHIKYVDNNVKYIPYFYYLENHVE